MKFRWVTAVVILSLAFGAGYATYVCVCKPMPPVVAGENAALMWLRYEFKLPEEKMIRIEKMHTAYQLVCDEHCRLVREARDHLGKLRASSAEHCDIVAAAEKVTELDQKCVTSLEAHLREIAGVIGGEEGQRYLAIVLPRISHFDHSGTPNLDVGTKAQTNDHHAHH